MKCINLEMRYQTLEKNAKDLRVNLKLRYEKLSSIRLRI